MADDDPYNLDLHIHILKELGFDTIETAADGQALLDKFKSKPEKYFEFVITDVSMPGMDGIEAGQKIREFEANQNRQHRVKIGFITGHSNTSDKQKCENEPISAFFYLPKPITLSVLEGFLDPINACSSEANKRIVDVSSYGRAIKNPAPLILCVDDDIFNLDCLSEMLESLGAKAIKARSGEEGLTQFKRIVLEEGISLNFVLMDCNMNGMDGWMDSLS